jgi:hypothetical protein
VFIAAALGMGGCQGVQPSVSYAPGLGEIMTLTQMRHAKVWLAGRAGNWALASYETDELEEGFDDVVAFHPTHKTAPVPLTELVPKMMSASLRELRNAIEAKDASRFDTAFDAVTVACNSCHHATNFDYNVVVKPASNFFTNQDFSAPGQCRLKTSPPKTRRRGGRDRAEGPSGLPGHNAGAADRTCPVEMKCADWRASRSPAAMPSVGSNDCTGMRTETGVGFPGPTCRQTSIS